MNMHNHWKKPLALFLMLLVLPLSVTSVYATEEKDKQNEAKEKEIDDLEQKREETIDQIHDLKDNIGEIQKEINSLTTEKKTIQGYISDLDAKSQKLTKQIEQFEAQIAQKETDIQTTKEELEQAKAECDEQYDMMKQRIRYIYENPTGSLWEVLVTADSIADFLNRAEGVSSLSDYDRQMMDALVAVREEIALEEQTLEAELEELQMMREEVSAQKKKINDSLNKKKGELQAKADALGDAADEKSDYKKQLEKQEKLLNQIEEQIAQAANGNAYEGSVTGFIWPCPEYTRISSGFGPRPQPTPGASTNHKGVDLAAPYGSRILASAAGVVTTSTYSKSAGNYVVISHGKGVSTVYMHASALLVSVGDTVEQGQVIAKVGSTGYSTGNHLHFGVIKNGKYVNPMGYISP